MASGRLVPILLLGGVVVTANFGMFDLAKSTGTMYLPDILVNTNRVLAGTRTRIDLPETGIAPLDNFAAFMVSVFWSDLDPKNFKGHLQGHHFLGQLSAAWLLMLVECHRANRGLTFVAFTYFMETLGELVGVGFSTPLWCIAHLVLTRAPSSKDKSAAARDFLPRASSLGALGYAYVLGHIVPMLLMSFCAIDGRGVWSQQIWILVRLIHPILMLVLWKAFVVVQSTANDRSAWLSAAASRKFYTFAIVSSAIHHASALGIMFADHWIQGWVKPEVLAALDFKTTLLPFPFWKKSTLGPVTFAEGVAMFLQWDEALTVTSVLIWTTTLYVETSRDTGKNSGRLSLLLQTLLMGAVAGPLAGAAFLMQERDNLVVAGLEERYLKQL